MPESVQGTVKRAQERMCEWYWNRIKKQYMPMPLNHYVSTLVFGVKCFDELTCTIMVASSWESLQYATHWVGDAMKAENPSLLDRRDAGVVSDAEDTPLSGKPTVAETNKIKTLPPSVIKDLEQKNIARKLADLSPIVIDIRRCIACRAWFESAGHRTCGCASPSSADSGTG